MSAKKRKRDGSEEGHGGSSWKVAYADFVTALMAFFLLLWLITMVAPEKQALVSRYFQHFSIFDKSGKSILDGMSYSTEKGKRRSLIEQKEENDETTPVMELFDPPRQRQERIKNLIRQGVETKLSGLKDQILVDTFEDGVKIEMVDKIESPMFPLGSSQLTPNAKEVIAVITNDINSTNNKIAIEGHTDALSYSTNRYTNWELSTERASAARRELEKNGLNPDRIIRVSGHAATVPIITEDPLDPRNRRISILLFTEMNDAADSEAASILPEPEPPVIEAAHADPALQALPANPTPE